MRIEIVPVLLDNYAYLLIDEATRTAAVVDPAEAAPVLAAAGRAKATLTAALCTHHHWDHIGGLDALIKAAPGLKVYGHTGDRDRIPQLTDGVDEGARVTVAGAEAAVLHVPCHTSGHVAYWFEKEDAVFTGDTLFAGGCGHLYEGTAEDMRQNFEKLLSLPEDAQIYFGHEYTEKNLRFAAGLEPNNRALRDKHRWAEERVAQGLPTPPSTVRSEKETNPFARVDSWEIQKSLLSRFPEMPLDPTSVFARLRSLKDRF